MKIFVTGTAGFIGYHVAKRLLEDGHDVTGLDNINDYYDIALKDARLIDLGILKGNHQSIKYPGLRFFEGDLCDKELIDKIFEEGSFDIVIHLAAQAGVRYSLENAHAYINSNIQGFMNVLEACRNFKPKHLIYASSSSVYGLNRGMPFSTKDHTDHPVSLYAASKKANELMAHTYAHLFGVPCSGLRFFTVYGPWGRPDMAYFKFTEKILAGETIDVYNNGDLMRDFTYIDDIVEGIVRLMDIPPSKSLQFDPENPDPSMSSAPYRLYNIGNHSPVKLMEFITTLEDLLGKKASKNFLPMQAGDVYATYADISELSEVCGFEPSTSLQEGLDRFVNWYKEYH